MNRTIKTLLFGGAGSTLAVDLGLLILRAGTGLLMAIGHGKSKLFHDGGFGPSEGFIKGVSSLNMPAPTFFAWCAALAEFFGGLLLAVGLLTRPMALVLTINMLVAAFGVHLKDPIFKPDAPGGYKEPALMFLLPFVALLLTGPGRFSLDWLIIGQTKRTLVAE